MDILRMYQSQAFELVVFCISYIYTNLDAVQSYCWTKTSFFVNNTANF